MPRRHWIASATALVTLAAGVAAWANRADQPPLPPGATAERVVVDKRARTLTLLDHGRPLKTYRVSLGAHPLGPKQQEGDERTPEGVYRLDYRKAESSAHRALHISYPDSADLARARARGVAPGGSIMVHGITNGLGWVGRLHRLVDWTDGCVAVTNAEMDEIWRAVPAGTPIEIRP
ncbi:MAG TPA: L,D-transpeptidase family protein [Longimicrobium sp.]|jgi:murein L,D-transpeptidase YafK